MLDIIRGVRSFVFCGIVRGTGVVSFKVTVFLLTLLSSFPHSDHDNFLRMGIDCEDVYHVQGYEGPESILRFVRD